MEYVKTAWLLFFLFLLLEFPLIFHSPDLNLEQITYFAHYVSRIYLWALASSPSLYDRLRRLCWAPGATAAVACWHLMVRFRPSIRFRTFLRLSRRILLSAAPSFVRAESGHYSIWRSLTSMSRKPCQPRADWETRSVPAPNNPRTATPQRALQRD